MRSAIRSKAPVGKLMSFGLLIVGQVLPPAFMAGTLPAIFRQKGLELEQFWIFSIASLPYWFKWLWSPILDRYGSHGPAHFHPWILACTLFAAFAYLTLGLVPPTVETVALTCGLLMVCNFAMATQDIAVDGFVVQSTGADERGPVAGILGLANQIGQLLASAGLVLLYEFFGWIPTVAAAAGMLVLCTLPALLRRPDPAAPRPRSKGPLLAGLAELLRRRETPAIFLLVFVFALSLFFIYSLQGAFLVDKGLSLIQIGIISGIFQSIGFGAGAALAAWIIARFGLRSACRLGMASWLLSFIPFVALAWLPAPSLALTGSAMLVAALLASPLFYVISAARLGWTSSHQPATDYTAQSSINAIGIAAGGVLAAFVASSVGWQGLFAAAALLGVLAGALFLLLEGWVERAVGARRQGDEASQPVGDHPGVAEAVA